MRATSDEGPSGHYLKTLGLTIPQSPLVRADQVTDRSEVGPMTSTDLLAGT
jgi:hypothetical protein